MISVRPIGPEDASAWAPLWRGYLAFYEAAHDETIARETFRRLNEDPRYFAFVAEDDGRLVGIVQCVIHASTWTPCDYCYLGDLFVDPASRGKGAARALIEAVYEEARRRGLARVHWLTQESNHTARKLYDKLASYDGFVQYRRKI